MVICILSVRNMTEKNVQEDFNKPDYALQLILSGLIICLCYILQSFYSGKQDFQLAFDTK